MSESVSVQEISVALSENRGFDIILGADILKNIGIYIKSRLQKENCSIFIISDENVFPHYGEIVSKSLVESCFSVYSYIVKPGEESKSIETYAQVLTELAKSEITRTDIIIALGGGVVGDLSGFCAASYLRGIDFIQVPTTLLAAVDSSVGGKTGINLSCGKNLVGAFHQPKLVLCDVKTLDTLDETILLDGLAESIKYGILFDKELYEVFQKTKSIKDLNMTMIIKRCVEHKRDVVIVDEFEKGVRKLLNLGHTIAHAYETLSNYEISHGLAVGIGMLVVAKISEKIDLAEENISQSLYEILKKFGMPRSADFSAEEIKNIVLHDKKRSSDTVTFILPKRIGLCTEYKVKASDLVSFIQQGL